MEYVFTTHNFNATTLTNFTLHTKLEKTSTFRSGDLQLVIQLRPKPTDKVNKMHNPTTYAKNRLQDMPVDQLCLSSTYFQFKDSFYEQLEGAAIGSLCLQS